MILLDPTIEFKFDFSAQGATEIMQNIHVILTTMKGTVPLDRGFGVDVNVIDLPVEKAKAWITVEYIKAVRKHEPRAKIKQVTFTHDAINGTIKPKAVIDLV